MAVKAIGKRIWRGISILETSENKVLKTEN